MFIKRVHLGNFGNFKNFDINFKDGANILLAPNEWGKSTVIDFIFAALYGMDRRNTRNVRQSNRSRNLPWGENKMDGILYCSAQGKDFSLQCDFGEQPRLDKIVLRDESLHKELKLGKDETVGKQLFGLGESAFMQSVYVEQMSLALDVEDDKEGELQLQLANLGSSGSSKVSVKTVAERLTEAQRNLSSERRKDAIIPNLKQERLHLQQRYSEAKARERKEADDLKQIKRVELELNQLNQQKRQEEHELEKAEFLLEAYKLNGALANEKLIKKKKAQLDRQRDKLETLEPSVFSAEFIDLKDTLKKIEVEQNILVAKENDLKIKRGQMENSMRAFKQEEEELKSQGKDEESFNRRKTILDEREKTCERERQTLYTDQQLNAEKLEQLNKDLDKTSLPNTENKEKKEKRIGIISIALGAIAGILLGILLHPAAFAILALVLPGFYLLNKSKKSAEKRNLLAAERANLAADIEEAKKRQNELTEQLELIDSTLVEIDEEQGIIKETERKIGEIEDKAIRARNAYKEDAASLRKRLTHYCDAVDDLLQKYPYLNNENIIDKILSSESTINVEKVELSSDNLDKNYSTQLLQEELDDEKRRFNAAGQLLQRFAQAYDDVSRLDNAISQHRKNLDSELSGLGAGRSEGLPSARWQELAVEGEKYGLVLDDSAALPCENYDDCAAALDLQRAKVEKLKQHYKNTATKYNQLEAYINAEYRNQERSENIALRLDNINKEIKAKEDLARQIDIASDYLQYADDEISKNFSPELCALTSSYLERLTLGRYDKVQINEELELNLHFKNGPSGYKEAEYMSGGCYDQIYLALRLALSELITQEAIPPLILDDALVQFDDERLYAALELLAELSQEESEASRLGESRQILLFTCQQRVAKAAEDLNIYHIQDFS